MKIGVYALCRNEEKHVFDWAESCDDADLAVVTDTGSTDTTVQRLKAAGATVATGYVCPWRWDDAHNLSLNHLPPDVDVAIRLDLDERLQPGWREAIERAWVDGTNNLRYRYVWSWKDHPGGQTGLTFHADRVHGRHGFRWAGPLTKAWCVGRATGESRSPTVSKSGTTGTKASGTRPTWPCYERRWPRLRTMPGCGGIWPANATTPACPRRPPSSRPT